MRHEIKKEIDEIAAKIKKNSKDAHYADTLINTLLSLKGQYDIEPTLIHLPSTDLDKKIEGEAFRICICKSGEAVYHMKGGVDIVVQPKANSLYTYLVEMVEIWDKLNNLEAEERQIIEDDLTASAYVLNIPFIAFGDLEFKYKLANETIDYLAGLQQKMIDNPTLQEETPIENAHFEEAMVAMDEAIKDIENGKKDSIS